ncbi:hypothetical protein B0H14DRAFT_2606141 [Mycena olivaceomarginata]|nr:hypothetical protein B0H14DRAFT_2606141 [Mycena olivaceomarginata]
MFCAPASPHVPTTCTCLPSAPSQLDLQVGYGVRDWSWYRRTSVRSWVAVPICLPNTLRERFTETSTSRALTLHRPADDAADDIAQRFATDTDGVEGVLDLVDELTEVLRLSMEDASSTMLIRNGGTNQQSDGSGGSSESGGGSQWWHGKLDSEPGRLKKAVESCKDTRRNWG